MQLKRTLPLLGLCLAWSLSIPFASAQGQRIEDLGDYLRKQTSYQNASATSKLGTLNSLVNSKQISPEQASTETRRVCLDHIAQRRRERFNQYLRQPAVKRSQPESVPGMYEFKIVAEAEMAAWSELSSQAGSWGRIELPTDILDRTVMRMFITDPRSTVGTPRDRLNMLADFKRKGLWSDLLEQTAMYEFAVSTELEVLDLEPLAQSTKKLELIKEYIAKGLISPDDYTQSLERNAMMQYMAFHPTYYASPAPERLKILGSLTKRGLLSSESRSYLEIPVAVAALNQKPGFSKGSSRDKRRAIRSLESSGQIDYASVEPIERIVGIR